MRACLKMVTSTTLIKVYFGLLEPGTTTWHVAQDTVKRVSAVTRRVRVSSSHGRNLLSDLPLLSPPYSMPKASSSKTKYYAVRIGREGPKIYGTWEEVDPLANSTEIR